MNNGYPNIQVSKGMAGWFALKVWWNPDGFPEPFETGDGRYRRQEDAIEEARNWAETEGLPFIMPAIDGSVADQDVEAQMRKALPGLVVIHVGKGAK